MSTVEVLKAAKALIENESRWTRTQYARTIFGWSVKPRSIWAYRRCAWGALDVYGRQHSAGFLCCAAVDLFGDGPIYVNDVLGHAAVMQMYDRAIELAMAKESSQAVSGDRDLVYA